LNRDYWFRVTKTDKHGLRVREVRAIQAPNKREAINKAFPKAPHNQVEIKKVNYFDVKKWSLE